MIAPRVIEELDKFKVSTNERLRVRARKALKQIEDAAKEPDLALVIRADPLLIRAVIFPGSRFDWSRAPMLDPAKPDDQLVAEAIAFGNDAAVFSHDTGPRIRALIARIPAYSPLADWLLPVQKTDDQRKISDLERALEKALATKPEIAVTLENLSEASSELTLIAPLLPPIDNEMVDVLTKRYLELHPRASLRVERNRLAFQLGGISEGAADSYYESYLNFTHKARLFFERLHVKLNDLNLVVGIPYSIRNDGGVVAQGLRVEFYLAGNASLLADREDAETLFGPLDLPEPPSEPQSGFDLIRDSLPLHNISTFRDAMAPRDPVQFFWYERPKVGSTHSALQCESFRPTRVFHDEIFLFSHEGLPASADLRLHVSAANLPLPVDVEAKVHIVREAAEWLDSAVQIALPQSIRELFS
jgi:hypothetical protein